MTAQLIDGVALSRQIRAEVAQRAAALTARGHQPGLAVILVGEELLPKANSQQPILLQLVESSSWDSAPSWDQPLESHLFPVQKM